VSKSSRQTHSILDTKAAVASICVTIIIFFWTKLKCLKCPVFRICTAMHVWRQQWSTCCHLRELHCIYCSYIAIHTYLKKMHGSIYITVLIKFSIFFWHFLLGCILWFITPLVYHHTNMVSLTILVCTTWYHHTMNPQKFVQVHKRIANCKRIQL